MKNCFKILTRIQDLPELHRELRKLECSCQELDNAINFIPITIGGPFEEALAAFLKAIQSFRHGSADEFRGIAESMKKWRHVPDKRARFLTGRCYCLLATHYWRQGNLPEAENYANEAGVIGYSFDFQYLEAESLQVLARIKSAKCEWDVAERIADLARSKFTQDGRDIRGQALAWDALGRVRFERGRFAQARQDLETSMSLWRNCLDEYGMVETMLLYMHLFYHLQEFETCSRLLNEVEALCNNLSYRRGLGTIARYRGKICLLEENRDESVRLFYESLRIFNSIGAPEGQARAHLSLARAYAEGKEYKKAFSQYIEARRIFSKIRDHVREAMVLVTKGLLHAGKDPNDRIKPEKLFASALKIFRDRDDRRHVATALFEIGRQHLRWGNYDKASEYIQESMRLASSMQANRLVDRLETEKITVEARKYASLVSQVESQRYATKVLLTNALHDIRNMLVSITAKGGKKADHIIKICNGVLEVGKHGMGKIDFKESSIKDVKLCDKVDDAIDIVEPEAYGVDIQNRIDKDMMVQANENHLDQMLVNLIGNAQKYAAKKDAKHEVTLDAKTTNDGYVQVTIADGGKGIQSKYHEKVFTLFEQGEILVKLDDTEKAECGFGVGLAYCKLVAESHGGEIWVDPDETRRKGEDPNRTDYHGTVIHFTLPNNLDNTRK